jgi:hypothetical protein
MTMLLYMMSMMVTAQSFVVVDKNGKKTAYDVSKIDSVTFQNATHGFTLHEQRSSSADGQTTINGKSTSYNFEDVQNIFGDTEYIFANLCYTYGKDYRQKVATPVECPVSDPGYTLRNVYFFHIAPQESHLPDFGHPFRDHHIFTRADVLC